MDRASVKDFGFAAPSVELIGGEWFLVGNCEGYRARLKVKEIVGFYPSTDETTALCKSNGEPWLFSHTVTQIILAMDSIPFDGVPRYTLKLEVKQEPEANMDSPEALKRGRECTLAVRDATSEGQSSTASYEARVRCEVCCGEKCAACLNMVECCNCTRKALTLPLKSG